MYDLGSMVVYKCARCPCEGPPPYSIETGEIAGIIDNRTWSDAVLYKIVTNQIMRVVNAFEIIMVATI